MSAIAHQVSIMADEGGSPVREVPNRKQEPNRY